MVKILEKSGEICQSGNVGTLKCTKHKKVFISYEAKKNCQLKHEGKPKSYQCSIGDCEIRFYNRRSQKKHEIEQHGAHVLGEKVQV